jgi:hypothetical protein
LEADIIAAAYDEQSSSGVQSESENGLQEEHNFCVTVVYKKVNQFLENCDHLKKAPDALYEHCRHMECVAGDLEKTVSELQDEALSSLDAS